jgi:hypothetical protein
MSPRWSASGEGTTMISWPPCPATQTRPIDARFAATDLFGHVVAHGMWTAALVSAALGTKLPVPGTIYLGETFGF